MSTVTITDLARENVRNLTLVSVSASSGGNGDVWLNANEYSHTGSFSLLSKRSTATRNASRKQ